MNDDKKAIKIMDALSGVDEELLARSEAAGAGAAERSRGTWRYLSRCAAALALIAVGAASWGGYRLTQKEARDQTAAEELQYSGNTAGDVYAQPDDAPVPAASRGIEEAEPPGDRGHSFDYAQAEGMLTDAERDNGDFGSEEKELSMIQGNAVLEYAKLRELTESEARSVEKLGACVPTVLPEGYVFESARSDPESGMLLLCWRRGMDDIRLAIEKVEEKTVRTVDVTKPETYDQRLYSIPHADSVPENYRQTMQSPVFEKKDFSLEIVRSRVISYSGDGGDTATPRGVFSVLCDGVLVKFNGRATPEQVWEMFASMGILE